MPPESVPSRSGSRSYYFGCRREAGHGFHRPDGRSDYQAVHVVPWGYGVEHLMPAHQREGEAALHHRDGWTALSFADRTVDSRRGSHSTFVFEGDLNFQEALARARAEYPWVFRRFSFDVVEAMADAA